LKLFYLCALIFSQWLLNSHNFTSLNTSSKPILNRSFTFIQPFMLPNSNSIFHLMILHCGIFYLHSFESQLTTNWQQCHVFKLVFTSCNNSTTSLHPISMKQNYHHSRKSRYSLVELCLRANGCLHLVNCNGLMTSQPYCFHLWPFSSTTIFHLFECALCSMICWLTWFAIELETPILRVQFPFNYVNIQVVDVNALQFGCLILPKT